MVSRASVDLASAPSKGTVGRKYYPVVDVYHGVNHSPEYYDFHLYCDKILIPFNLIWQGKIKSDYVHFLKDLNKTIIIDSGAAAFYINAEKKRAKRKQVEYPEGYLEKYLDFIEDVQPTFAFALDTCFEEKEFQTIPQFARNIIRQKETIEAAQERGLSTKIYPVVQGWERISYRFSARLTGILMKENKLDRFGIGSICQAKRERVREVLSWINPLLDLSQAHAFGQTQRTAVVLKEFGIKSLDSSNGSGNAGRFSYCDPTGTWFYSRKSNQGSRKHNLDQGFQKQRDKYLYLFFLNVESLDFSCFNQVPDWWEHPVTG